MNKKKVVIAIGAILCTLGVSVSGLKVYAHAEKQAVVDKGKSERAYVIAREVTGGSDKSYGNVKLDVGGKTYLLGVSKEQYDKAAEGSNISVYEYNDKVAIVEK